jgi:multidrug efflux pump subunit AcrB
MGTMPGLIERYNGQHIVSLTANLHGITLGEAAVKLNKALASAGVPPRGVSDQNARRDPGAGADSFGLRVPAWRSRSW